MGSGRRGGDEISVAFWNVAGMWNKDKELSEGLEKWVVLILMETWIEGNDWGRIRERPSNKHEWRFQEAKNKSRRGKAIGGMIMAIRKEWRWKEKEEETGEEGIVVGSVKYGKGRIRVVGVYMNGDMEKKLEGVREWIEGREERVRTIFGGDFNDARTGDEGGMWGGGGGGNRKEIER